MIITRFPPEPNGYLHLGHLKSMYLNFNYPKDNGGGYCLLRLDDTNPDTEKQEFVDNIIKNVDWFGFKPEKITYTSDYFDDLYNYAIKLININLAYVDELSSEQISEYRRSNKNSPFRTRSIEENLKLFEEMKNGKHKEDTLCLRLKIDDTNNSSMKDPIAYRIKYTPHYRTGDKWCIYPSYDLSHCIIDSLENITHSFCTLEFFIRRELYYWILDKLELRKPIVEEFNRLVTDFGILSKRKIKELIDNNIVENWSDPLLITINGLINKGYSPDILIKFCKELAYTQNIGSTIKKHLLDNVTRNYLNEISDRCFAVISPLKIVITNFEEDTEYDITRPNNPLDSSKGESVIKLRKYIYIDKSDFRESANKKYYRLKGKEGSSVRLKYAGIITYQDHIKDNNGDVIEVHVTYTNEQKKVKSTIQWTSNTSEKEIVYFDYDNMKKDKFIGYVDESNMDYLQFERIGYFKKINNNLYHHLTNLKEDKNK